MPNGKPGPKPEFTEEFLLKMTPAQRAALDWVSAEFGMSISALIRWFIDEGTHAVLSVITKYEEATSGSAQQLPQGHR